jgi:hypothetical protein
MVTQFLSFFGLIFLLGCGETSTSTMATLLSMQTYRYRSSLSPIIINRNPEGAMNLLARRIPMRVAALLVVLPDIVLALSSTTSSSLATTNIRHFTSTAIHTRSDRDTATLAISTAKLQSIASECAVKVPGSLSYLRTWRRWSETAIDLIRDDLRDHNLPAPVDQLALSDLSYHLGQAADVGAMPSFQDEGARAGYAVDYFCRAQLLADLLFESRSGVGLGVGLEPAFWVDSIQKNLLLGLGSGSSASPTSSYRLCSLGGGPAFDFVGLALISSFHWQQQQYEKQQQQQQESSSSVAIPITATILDYEHGWSPFVHAMSTSVDSVLGGSHSCVFAGCDITLPLSDPVNARCAQEVLETDLWVCSYCVSENAVKLRQGDHEFFRDVFGQAKENSIFVFTETTHRLWPELVDVALETAGFDVAFPRRNGRGKSGRQLILRKRAGATTLGAEAMEQREAFERDSAAHKRKIQDGFRREKRKIPGAK